MSSISSMFLGGLGCLGAAGCLGWTKSDRSSMRNGNKKCFVSQPTHCTIMSSLSSMFLGGLGCLGTAGCFGWTKWESSSIGNGKMIVEFFSALIEFRVCKYLN
jgi:hypothetical protein